MLHTVELPLTNERARLRPLQAADAAAYAEGTEDPAVRLYAHLPEPYYTPATVRAMIGGVVREGLEKGDLAVLAIAAPATDEFAGSLVLFDVTPDAAEVGFWLRPAYRGSGLAGAALDLAARLARCSGLARLTARTATDNSASQRVLTRAGFNEAGRTTATAPSGAVVDLVHYSRPLGGTD